MNRAVAALAAMAALTLGCTSDHGPTIYVSTLGDDAWSGRLPEASPDRTDGPFGTLERARDARVAPARVLLGEADDEPPDLLHYAAPTPSMLFVGPLERNQPPVPAHDRVGRDDGRDAIQ